MTRILFSIITLLSFVPVAYAAEPPFLPVTEITSPDGWTAWLVEDHSQPIISLSFGFLGAGSINDPVDKQGLARILSNTLDEGAGPYTSTAFQKELDDNTISLSFSTGRDDFFGQIKTLTDTSSHAFDLLKLALTQPRFDTDALARMVTANIARIQQDRTDPEWLAARLMNEQAFGSTPYGQNSGGTLTTLKKITPDDLRKHTQDHFRLTNLRIAVVGDITRDELLKQITETFENLPKEAPPAKNTPIHLQNSGQTFIHPYDIPQTVLLMSAPAPTQNDPDAPAYDIMNYILGGGGFGSRLMTSVREQSGLSYGIYSSVNHMTRSDYLTISGSTKNETAGTMLEKINTEIKKMTEKGITRQELDSAKGYILGAMPLDLTSTDRIANVMLGYLMDNKQPGDFDRYRKHIAAVTHDDVARVAHTWLTPDKFIRILVGRPQGISQQAIPVPKISNIE